MLRASLFLLLTQSAISEASTEEEARYKARLSEALSNGRSRLVFGGVTYAIVRDGLGVSVYAVDPVGDTVELSTASTSTAEVIPNTPLTTSVSTTIGVGASASTPSASTVSLTMGNKLVTDSWEDEDERGKGFTTAFCKNRDSKKCAVLRERFFGPGLAAEVTRHPTAEPLATAAPPRVYADPCKTADCYTWRDFRTQVVGPFVAQMVGGKALEKFTDDKVEASMFGKGFQQWHEVMQLPLDGQVISTATSTTMMLKLLMATLSQIRLLRVSESEDGEEENWTLWLAMALSLPGFLVLIVYLAVSVWQIKAYWKRRLLVTEEEKANRIFEHVARIQNQQQARQGRGQAVAIDMNTLSRRYSP